MKAILLFLGAALVSLVGVAGCDRQPVDTTPVSPVEAPGPRGIPDDSVLTTKVKTALMAEPDINAADIAVTAEGGRVTLSGTVPAPQIMRAEAVARGVEGVVEVVNRLSSADGGGAAPGGGTS